LDGLLASGLSADTWRSAPHDDYSEALEFAQRGSSSLERYDNSGVLAELEEGINTLHVANRFVPENHPVKPACLSTLAIGLQMRFSRLGDIADLDEAIMAQQQAVRLTPDSHPDKPGCLNNLGISFQSRFERLGDIADLDEAITAKQQAVRLTPDGHPDKPGYLNNLGISLQSRFERLGDIRGFHTGVNSASTEKSTGASTQPRVERKQLLSR
jgi:tetratricopeptide (TPR) repeat protein